TANISIRCVLSTYSPSTSVLGAYAPSYGSRALFVGYGGRIWGSKLLDRAPGGSNYRYCCGLDCRRWGDNNSTPTRKDRPNCEALMQSRVPIASDAQTVTNGFRVSGEL